MWRCNELEFLLSCLGNQGLCAVWADRPWPAHQAGQVQLCFTPLFRWAAQILLFQQRFKWVLSLQVWRWPPWLALILLTLESLSVIGTSEGIFLFSALYFLLQMSTVLGSYWIRRFLQENLVNACRAFSRQDEPTVCSQCCSCCCNITKPTSTILC